jgi:putative transposon-encoded protein
MKKKKTEKRPAKKPVKKVAKKVVKAPVKKAALKQNVNITVHVKQEEKRTGKEIAVVDDNTLEPIREGGKYMIPKTWVSERQILAILQKTPKEYVHTRPAKGGGTWDYVPGKYIEKVLNYAFGWNWDFKMIKQECMMLETDHGQVITWGELTVKDDKGHQITKSQNGRAEVKYKKGTKIPMDLGNDYKASSTDCLKKCASLFGIASDIYGKQEFREMGIVVRNEHQSVQREPERAKPTRNQATALKTTVVEENWECHECGNPITEAEAKFSKRIFGKPLCRTCQGIYKQNKR